MTRQSSAKTATPVNDWYTAAEAAAILRISVWTLNRACRTGRIPGAVKIGRAWQCPRAEIEWLRAHGTSDGRTSPPAPAPAPRRSRNDSNVPGEATVNGVTLRWDASRRSA